MKSTIKLTDEFIESFLRGEVESKITDNIERVNKYLVTAELTKQLDNLRRSVDAYRRESDKAKRQELGNQILDICFSFRALGLFQNSAYSMKELDFYRARASASERQAADLQDKLKEAYTMIKKLTTT
jgi:cobalamin biosynthesis Mg chelatase CobN